MCGKFIFTGFDAAKIPETQSGKTALNIDIFQNIFVPDYTPEGNWAIKRSISAKDIFLRRNHTFGRLCKFSKVIT
jgi:hypothetical protein